MSFEIRVMLSRTVVAMLAAIATAVVAQEEPPRDAPYFPTPQSVVERMLELAKVSADDYVVDLGSGDGRIVITAAKKYGVRGFGVEIDRRLVSRSNYDARRAGVADRVKFVEQDLFATDLRPATVLTLYLFRELNLKLRPRILEQLRPGARVVTHDWDMGDWEPDYTETMPAPDKAVGIVRESKLFLWYVPAKVDGRWGLETSIQPARAALRLEQRFQRLSGGGESSGSAFTVAEGRLRGTLVRFRVADGPLAGEYVGTAGQSGIAGEILRNGAPIGTWKAVRE